MRSTTAPAWQVLLLDLKVDWPVSLVVSRRQMLQYQVRAAVQLPGRLPLLQQSPAADVSGAPCALCTAQRAWCAGQWLASRARPRPRPLLPSSNAPLFGDLPRPAGHLQAPVPAQVCGAAAQHRLGGAAANARADEVRWRGLGEQS
jgi:hypothetical protein